MEDRLNKWWKLNPKIFDHESSAAHVQSFTQWKKFEVRIARGPTIDEKQHEDIESQVKCGRKYFQDIIRILAKQNLALRGHQEGMNHEEADVNPEEMENREHF